jgi:hypothetical protein
LGIEADQAIVEELRNFIGSGIEPKARIEMLRRRI